MANHNPWLVGAADGADLGDGGQLERGSGCPSTQIGHRGENGVWKSHSLNPPFERGSSLEIFSSLAKSAVMKTERAPRNRTIVLLEEDEVMLSPALCSLSSDVRP